MDNEVELDIYDKIGTCVKNLQLFLSSDNYKTPPKCPYTNIIDQATGLTYCIPYSIIKKDETIEDITTRNSLIPNRLSEEERNIVRCPIDELFIHLENCRKKGVILHYCEQQYYHVKAPPPVVENNGIEVLEDENMDVDDWGNLVEEDEPDLKPKFVEAVIESGEPEDSILIDHSGIDLDFDIYQKENERKISEQTLYSLASAISGKLVETLDLTKPIDGMTKVDDSRIFLEFHVVILRKPALVKVEHSVYKTCYKESFRYRAPGVKITKEHKKYLIHKILESGILETNLSSVTILNPMSEVLDSGSVSHPKMFLGSAKKGSTVAHEFFNIYRVSASLIKSVPDLPPSLAAVNYCEDFKPKNDLTPQRTRNPVDKRKWIMVKPQPEYDYNLTYELSLHYEAPGGLIKKRNFEPRPALITEIKINYERTGDDLISQFEIDETDRNVRNLIVRDNQALYLKDILSILSPERSKEFETWKSVIIILARTNPDYKPLAIYFSQRYPNKWVKNGLSQLESIWNWALAHPYSSEEGEYHTEKYLYYLAKQDNPEKYAEIQESNAFMKLRRMIMLSNGQLNETDIATILHIMFNNVFICDVMDNHRVWYEFVFPENEGRLLRGYVYKWRCEKSYPDTLDIYISKKMPSFLRQIIGWIDEKIARNDGNESRQRYYDMMKKNLSKFIIKLGNSATISSIIKRCEIFFRERGFARKLDSDPNYIGVGNGVLKLYPGDIELCSSYHEIYISRTTGVNYEPYNPANPYVKELEVEIEKLFAGEKDAHEFIMCYLASSLDWRKRKPLFLILLGEGSNGKSFLLEMHINTLGAVINDGYAAKLNASFFTKDSKFTTGPDSEKMMLKNARFAYCSETKAGDILLIEKIKELTSDTITSRDLYKGQDMFITNCHYCMCSNNDPRITGRDYGTWRRILCYTCKMMFLEPSKVDKNNKYHHPDNKKFIEEYTRLDCYKKAYLSILTKWYEHFRTKYDGDLDKIYKPTIDRDTQKYHDEQDTVSKFITQQIHLSKSKDKVPDISFTNIVSKYEEWYSKNIDSRVNIMKEDVKRAIKEDKRLRKHVVVKHGGTLFLANHILLDIGTEYTDNISDEESPPASDANERDDNITSIDTTNLEDDL